MTIPANDNRIRPAWYDEKLLAYRPFIEKMAYRKARRWDKEEFVADVFVAAMQRWHLYSDSYSFGTWIGLICRNVIHERVGRESRVCRTGFVINIDDVDVPSIAHDDELPSLSVCIALLPEGRERAFLNRIASGETLRSIAKECAISHERVRQITQNGIKRIKSKIVMQQITRRLDDVRLTKEAA